jgi:SAM-dependent methyltransferase
MGSNVFDRVARDYEEIHNRSLPPGVCSDEFVRQKAPVVTEWILNKITSQPFCYLDYGCGNGRLFKLLVESDPLRPLIEKGSLRLFGFDTSVESLRAAKTIVGDERVCFLNCWEDLPQDARFDLVVSFNVFHHIVPAERSATARTLRSWMKPGAKFVIWEHNPFNPLTRLLVKLCPFDEDARLLSLNMTKRLFGANSYRYIRHEYVNIFPPKLQQLALIKAAEKMLRKAPIGAQYWVMFANDD